jgi:hypothetical protein
LKALIDHIGRPVTSRFITVRPRQKRVTLNTLWAILNSPIANAYAYCHMVKRDNIVGRIRKIPVPNILEFAALDEAVERYLIAASAPSHLRSASTLRKLMAEVDVEVLKLYSLPVEWEGAILALFRGIPRSGVPFEQHEFLPIGLENLVGLVDFNLFERDWNKTNALRGELIDKGISKALSPEEKRILEYLQAYADYYLDKTSPPDTSIIDALELRILGRSSH